MIRIEGLKKGFGEKEIIKGIDLSVNKGEVLGIIGPSGCGKSLMLRILMMLEEADAGKIYIDGKEISNSEADKAEARKKIGMVFQEYNLYQRFSVVENVMLGLIHIAKKSSEEAFEIAMRLLHDVGMADYAFMYPGHLSGGQKQRAAIARTLAMDPEIILMDEPTAALDPIVVGEVEAVIRMLASRGRTMIITTHEMSLIRKVCTKVAFVHDGRILEAGTPSEILDNAKNDETRRFVRALRVLEFEVESDSFDFIGMNTKLSQFALRNNISSAILDRVLSITEELCQMVIIQPKENNIMKMTFEYNDIENILYVRVKFSGPPLDPDDPMYFFSWPIICMRAGDIKNEFIDEDGYTNSVEMKLS